jgi:uncharacterized protein with HEPN domain
MSPSKSPILRLRHILEEIDSIARAIGGRTQSQCEDDYVMSRAIERALEIVSEAVRAIPEDWLKAYPDVRWDRIRGMGNFLRHEYHPVDGDVIWDAVKTNLPEIRFAIAEMLEKSGE